MAKYSINVIGLPDIQQAFKNACSKAGEYEVGSVINTDFNIGIPHNSEYWYVLTEFIINDENLLIYPKDVAMSEDTSITIKYESIKILGNMTYVVNGTYTNPGYAPTLNVTGIRTLTSTIGFTVDYELQFKTKTDNPDDQDILNSIIANGNNVDILKIETDSTTFNSFMSSSLSFSYSTWLDDDCTVYYSIPCIETLYEFYSYGYYDSNCALENSQSSLYILTLTPYNGKSLYGTNISLQLKLKFSLYGKCYKYISSDIYINNEFMIGTSSEDAFNGKLTNNVKIYSTYQEADVYNISCEYVINSINVVNSLLTGDLEVIPLDDNGTTYGLKSVYSGKVKLIPQLPTNCLLISWEIYLLNEDGEYELLTSTLQFQLTVDLSSDIKAVVYVYSQADDPNCNSSPKINVIKTDDYSHTYEYYSFSDMAKMSENFNIYLNGKDITSRDGDKKAYNLKIGDKVKLVAKPEEGKEYFRFFGDIEPEYPNDGDMEFTLDITDNTKYDVFAHFHKQNAFAAIHWDNNDNSSLKSINADYAYRMLKNEILDRNKYYENIIVSNPTETSVLNLFNNLNNFENVVLYISTHGIQDENGEYCVLNNAVMKDSVLFNKFLPKNKLIWIKSCYGSGILVPGSNSSSSTNLVSKQSSPDSKRSNNFGFIASDVGSSVAWSCKGVEIQDLALLILKENLSLTNGQALAKVKAFFDTTQSDFIRLLKECCVNIYGMTRNLQDKIFSQSFITDLNSSYNEIISGLSTNNGRSVLYLKEVAFSGSNILTLVKKFFDSLYFDDIIKLYPASNSIIHKHSILFSNMMLLIRNDISKFDKQSLLELLYDMDNEKVLLWICCAFSFNDEFKSEISTENGNLFCLIYTELIWFKFSFLQTIIKNLNAAINVDDLYSQFAALNFLRKLLNNSDDVYMCGDRILFSYWFNDWPLAGEVYCNDNWLNKKFLSFVSKRELYEKTHGKL